MTNILVPVLVIFVANLHLYFLVLEMFLWTKPIGMKTFGLTLDQATSTKKLAANQGLYNGFLAAGLFWGLVTSDPEASRAIELFFFSCVSIAGLYGGWRVNKKILFIQGLPAMLGIFLLV